jgi:hypothetical protein
MSRSKVVIWRLVAVAAIVVLTQAHVASVAIGAGTGNGRTTALCVQSCNDINAGCFDQCLVDCSVFGNPGDPAYDACKSTCESGCSVEKQECKKKCNVVHNPPSPTEP